MTHGESAARELEEPETPWIRNPEFVSYLNRKIAEERAHGVTIGEIASRGKMSVAQLKRWRGIGGPQSIPDPPNLIEFCNGNGWPLEEPFQVLGWGEPAALQAADRAEEAVFALLAVIRDPRTKDADRDRALEQLEFLTEMLRGRVEQHEDDATE